MGAPRVSTWCPPNTHANTAIEPTFRSLTTSQTSAVCGALCAPSTQSELVPTIRTIPRATQTLSAARRVYLALCSRSGMSQSDVDVVRKTHRQALEAAVAGLPASDDDSWTVPDKSLKAAGLADDVTAARKFVLQFALWARSAISRLPAVPAADMEATDFNDYYKIVMSRVQFLYSQAASGDSPGGVPELPICCFQTQLRRRPTFRKGGVDSCSGVFDLKGTFEPSNGASVVGSLESSNVAFRAALEAVGARRFNAATLRALITQRSQKAAGIESNLLPINDEWIAALDGKRLFTLLPDGAEFSDSTTEVECRMALEDGHVVLLAQGPWFRVTFCETALLQCMSRA